MHSCVCITIKKTRAAHIITQAVLPASMMCSLSMCFVAGGRDKMKQYDGDMDGGSGGEWLSAGGL